MNVPVHQRYYERHFDGTISLTTQGRSPFVLITGGLLRSDKNYDGRKATFRYNDISETWLVLSQVMGTMFVGYDLALCITDNWFGRLLQKWNHCIIHLVNWVYPREMRSLESLSLKGGDMLPRWTFTYMLNWLIIRHDI